MIPKFENSVLHTFLIKDIDINAYYNKTVIILGQPLSKNAYYLNQ